MCSATLATMRARAFAQTCTQAPEEKKEEAKPQCKKCELEVECLLNGGICKLCNARTVCLTRLFGSWPIGPYNEQEPAAKTDFWRSGAKLGGGDLDIRKLFKDSGQIGAKQGGMASVVFWIFFIYVIFPYSLTKPTQFFRALRARFFEDKRYLKH